MKAAAVQMVSGTGLHGNLVRARTLLQEAARQEAEIAVLPEYFCLLGGQDSDKLSIREQAGVGPIQDFLAETAHSLGLWIVGGTLPLAAGAGERAYNSSLVYSPQGECVTRYDKMHLFRYDNGRESYDESRTLLPGTRPVTFSLPSRDGHTWQVGLSVCYDLRFPELYRAHAQVGVDLMLVPSAFTYTTGQAHWDLLLRARAVENLAFVLAAAQGGQHECGRRTWGHSMLIDPWGQVLGVQAEGEAVVVAELDAARLTQCRRELPALSHRVL